MIFVRVEPTEQSKQRTDQLARNSAASIDENPG